MEPLRDYTDVVYRRWLASMFVCCAPRVRKQHQTSRGGSDASFMTWGLEKDDRIYQSYQGQDGFQQSQYMPTPAMHSHSNTYSHSNSHSHSRPRTRSSVHPAQWVDRTKSLASRASSRGSVYIRRSQTKKSVRRLTIGQPTDFRKVENVPAQIEVFHPLELSIYTPRNWLSPLPDFTCMENQNDRPLQCPAQALVPARTGSILSCTPSEFRIRRKPVASIQGFSVYGDQRRSVDTRSTPSTLNSEWTIQPLQSRPGLPVSPSTQELLEALQKRLPQEPPALRARSNTEPAAVMQRRSSEQIQRVKAALDHKQELEITLAKVSKKLSLRKKNVKLASDPTSPVVQEAQSDTPPPVPSKSPLMTRSTTTSAPKRNSRLVRSATFSGLSSLLYRPLPPTPLLCNQSSPPLPSSSPPKTKSPTAAAIETSTESDYPAPLQIPSRNRSLHRVTKWLFSPLPTTTTTTTTEIKVPSQPQVPSQKPFYQCTDPGATMQPTTYANSTTTTSASDLGSSESSSCRSSLRLSAASASMLTWDSLDERTARPGAGTPVSNSIVVGPGTPGRTRTFGKADRRAVGHQQLESVASLKGHVEVLVKEEERAIMAAVGMAY